MGLSRRLVRIELTTRTAESEDRVAITGMPLWEISWTERDHLGRDRKWSFPHITETSARQMVTNLLVHRAPGLAVEDVFIDRTR